MPEHSDRRQSGFETSLVVIVFFGVIVVSVAVALGVSVVASVLQSGSVTPGPTDAPIEVVSAGVNVVVSLGLLFLYTQLRDIQRRQTELMEAERTPRLLLADFEVGESPPSAGDSQGLELELVNAGSAPAFHLEARTAVSTPDDSLQGAVQSAEVVSATETAPGVGRDFLLPDGDEARFVTCPRAHLHTEDGSRTDSLPELLSRADAARFRVQLWIEGDTDISGQTARRDVFDYVVTVDDEPTLEELVETATPVELAEWPE